MINVRFRRLQADEEKSIATCNIVVMEFCDKGSLRYAMKRGAFHKRLGNTSVAVDLCAIVLVCAVGAGGWGFEGRRVVGMICGGGGGAALAWQSTYAQLCSQRACG